MKLVRTVNTQNLISNQYQHNMYIFNEQKFNEFRAEHPELRYFQALRHFIGVDRIEVVFPDDGELSREDTYYWTDEK